MTYSLFIVIKGVKHDRDKMSGIIHRFVNPVNISFLHSILYSLALGIRSNAHGFFMMKEEPLSELI